jgi:hypothetical protein
MSTSFGTCPALSSVTSDVASATDSLHFQLPPTKNVLLLSAAMAVTTCREHCSRRLVVQRAPAWSQHEHYCISISPGVTSSSHAPQRPGNMKDCSKANDVELKATAKSGGIALKTGQIGLAR